MGNYLAGFVDGEGTISLSKRTRYKEKGWYCYDPYLSIANTNLEVLKYFKKRIGLGTIRKTALGSVRFGHKICYGFWVSNRQARLVIKTLLPYLRIKKPQAELILAMPRRGGTFIPIEDTKRREAQEATYLALKKIHGRAVI